MPISNDASSIAEKDLLLSFFIVALKSFRYDSVLRPYPPSYFHKASTEKDIEKLRKVAARIPALEEVFKKRTDVSPDSLELLNWVISLPSFKLLPKHKDEFTYIKILTNQALPASAPNYIFAVAQSEQREHRFQALKREYGSLFAYHGSRLENFYSILHNGLASHLNKNGLFGSGIYFSSELSLSLHYSSSSTGWTESMLGRRLSCIAVCEIIDHPSVKRNTKDKNQAHRCYSPDSLAGEVPQKYYIVQNNDLVTVRYLLLYTFHTAHAHSNSWWRKYRFATLMISYCMILLAIAMSSSRSLQSVFKNFLS